MRHILVLLAFFPLCAFAHDSPEHKITYVSFQIARFGKNPDLLMERAHEHRALGHLADAAADFQSAYELDPTLISALKELALTQLAQNKADVALLTINRATDTNPPADFLIVRAEILNAQQNYRAALDACEAAFRETSDNPEWYLLRAQLQRRLGLFRDCFRDLREGQSKTGSAVLQEECIDAMIDAGEHKGALKQINNELRESRWRSSWLIRRARVRLALGQGRSAQRDLHTAIKEINSRLMAGTPELTLVIDRGLACALLGDTARAKTELALARTLSADAAAFWRLEKSLADGPPAR